MAARRGAFIVFEGVDRSGKSTQAKLLLQHLLSCGRDAELIAFPDREEPFGKVIDAFLKREFEINSREAVHLAFSLNRWQKVAELREKIANGIDVICDRYCFSGVAYSIAGGLDEKWTKQPDIGLPEPDIVLFFDVDPKVAESRGGFGDERLESYDLQKRVATELKKLQQPYWKFIDANQSLEAVSRQVQESVASLSLECPLRSVQSL